MPSPVIFDLRGRVLVKIGEASDAALELLEASGLVERMIHAFDTIIHNAGVEDVQWVEKKNDEVVVYEPHFPADYYSDVARVISETFSSCKTIDDAADKASELDEG